MNNLQPCGLWCVSGDFALRCGFTAGGKGDAGNSCQSYDQIPQPCYKTALLDLYNYEKGCTLKVVKGLCVCVCVCVCACMPVATVLRIEKYFLALD